MMTRRTAKTRHTARARGMAGVPAAALIAAHRPRPAAVVVADVTAPMLLPGLRPALAR